jgi:hypothetical protein
LNVQFSFFNLEFDMRDFILYSVVAILSVLGVAGAVTFIAQGRESQNANIAVSELISLVQNIQSVYSPTQSFMGISAANIINGGMVPVAMVSGTSIQNEFGGAVTVGAGSSGSTFVITESSLPGSVCSKLSSSMLAAATSLTINSTKLSSLSASAITADCVNAPTNVVAIEFGH